MANKSLRASKKLNTLSQLSPQQQTFLKYYIDPKSPTFSRLYASATKAGYKPSYARKIEDKKPTWLLNNKQLGHIYKAATNNLNDALLGKLDSQKDGARKDIQWDATKFVASTIGKEQFSKAPETVNQNNIQINWKEEKSYENAMEVEKEDYEIN